MRPAGCLHPTPPFVPPRPGSARPQSPKQGRWSPGFIEKNKVVVNNNKLTDSDGECSTAQKRPSLWSICTATGISFRPENGAGGQKTRDKLVCVVALRKPTRLRRKPGLLREKSSIAEPDKMKRAFSSRPNGEDGARVVTV
jgi:hypothetical protein